MQASDVGKALADMSPADASEVLNTWADKTNVFNPSLGGGIKLGLSTRAMRLLEGILRGGYKANGA